MQISAISPSFQGRRDNIDALVNMDDNTMRQIAYLQTAEKVDHKKNRKITNALFYSAPLAAGLAEALLSKGGKTKIFSKEITGVAARMAKGLKVTAGWTAALGAIDLLAFGKRKIAENSTEVRKFDRENPLLSLFTMLAVGIGAIALVNKGASKLGKVKAPDFMKKATGKVAKFINENKYMLKAKNGLLGIAKRTPVALKDIGAVALDWAPTALLFGGLLHSISSSAAENREFARNYNNIRERQTKFTQARVRELSMQNDLLMQDI